MTIVFTNKKIAARQVVYDFHFLALNEDALFKEALALPWKQRYPL